MSATLLAERTPLQTRIARREGGRLTFLEIVPHVPPESLRPREGDVYRARIAGRLEGGGLVLDLGPSGEGFLRAGNRRYTEGAVITAEVVHGPLRGKRARLKPALAVESAQGPLGRVRSDEPRLGGRLLKGAARVIASEGEEFALWRGLFRDRPEIALEAARNDGALLEAHGLEAEVERALEPTIGLGAGHMTIETTEALTAIDVDLGGAAAPGGAGLAAVNAAAVGAIAHAILLRRLAGRLLVDFAGTPTKAAARELLRALMEALGAAGLGAVRGGLTPSLLIELVVPRTAPRLAELLTEAGATHTGLPVRLSPFAATARLQRSLLRPRRASAERRIAVSPALLAWHRGEGAPALAALVAASPARLNFEADARLPADGFSIIEEGA